MASFSVVAHGRGTKSGSGEERSGRFAGKRIAGLTIVELLVAIAIVAVLIAAFLPSITKARAWAHTVECINNQHSLFQGLMVYQSDYTMQPDQSANRRDDTLGNAPTDPTSGACIWGQKYYGPSGVADYMGLGQLLPGEYVPLKHMFCPENVNVGDPGENPERRWWKRTFLLNLGFVAGGAAGDNYVKTYPGGDGLGLPQPNTASIYFRSHYLFRSGDWSYTTGPAATSGTALSSLTRLRSDFAGYNNKMILMDFRHWYHERVGSGVVETWGDGSSNFKKNSLINGGVIPSAWRTAGGFTYAASGGSVARSFQSTLGCAYFDHYEYYGR